MSETITTDTKRYWTARVLGVRFPWQPKIEMAPLVPLVADLRRWSTLGGRDADEKLKKLRGAAGKPTDQIKSLDTELDELAKTVPALHARGEIVYQHKVECAKLQPLITAADVAASQLTTEQKSEPRFAALVQASTAYVKARDALPALKSEDANALARKRTTLQTNARTLIDTFAQQFRSGDLYDKLKIQSGPLRERAGLVNPATLDQARLKQDYERAPAGNLDQLLAKIAKAEALLRQVGTDGSAAPVTDQRAYVRLLAAQSSRLDYASGVKTPMVKLTGKKKTLADAVDAFGNAKTKWSALDGKLASGTADDRFTKALVELRATITCADTLIKLRQDKVNDLVGTLTSGDIGTMKDKDKQKLTKNTRGLIEGADPVLLAGLTAGQQAGLLKALRADPKFKKDKKEKYEELQAKMYRATKLDPQFLNYEKGKRDEVIQELMKDKAGLKQSRDEWPLMDEDKKMAVLKKLAKAHCDKLGFDPPKTITFVDDSPGTSGAFNWGSSTLEINRKGYGFNDFELMLDTIFHENSHNWQMQIAQRMRGEKPPPIAGDDPIRAMALLFDANHGHKSDEAYEDQPKEKHSFRAGPKTARALMRALAN